ncbi:hypothetical protein INS49_009576 [Diaporthe citri]|uniref:uncharacterized protein n=1 Tax=Diaporthe citri TaxID=83186 RepID=UPI001C7F4ECA|nr:uncharacterized protein INS49_009576 [Diaporthe citri]KAG6361351.1 hypothetical protein INS49_009576 [Diaporthe citri]
MKPNRIAKAPVAKSSTTNDVGLDSIRESIEIPQESPFLWKNCANESQRDRIDIKQQAVFDGLRLGEKISSILRSRYDERQDGTGALELSDWDKQFDAAKESYESFHFCVGLLGMLGSGKTSLINALLDEQELLPSSSDKAATAVLCEVVYNHRSTGYRAEVVFRTRQSLADELNKLFVNIKLKEDLEKRIEENNGSGDFNNSETDQDIEDQLADIDTSIAGTLEVVAAVWGFDEQELKDMSTETLLQSQSLGSEVLGTIHEITETNSEIFANMIKPFVDSTPGIDGGIHAPLTLWPLIEKVTIYTKSDILKYGLRLRDLPGLGDAVERRSKVAEENSTDLDITAVITPAIRATEERTAVGLIKGHQALRMQMDGKFNRSSFCVVLSKTDDIESEVYLRRTKAAKNDIKIQRQLARVRELDRFFHAAGLGQRNQEQQNLGSNSSGSSYNMSIEGNRSEASAIKECLEQTAVSMRNRDIAERIQNSFLKRQQDAHLLKSDELHDGTVEVFGTSARAYWKSKHPDGEKTRGFPDEIHSGIPRLKQWILEAMFIQREKQLDTTLNDLLTLFVRIQDRISAGRADFQGATKTGENKLALIHQRHLWELTETLKHSCNKLSWIKPLKNTGAALDACQERCPHTVNRWRYRYPEQNGHQKLHANIQTSILSKQGESHQSKGKYPHEYHWIDDLTKPFFDAVLRDWTRAFQYKLPMHHSKISISVEPEWQSYEEELVRLLGKQQGPQLQHALIKIQGAIYVAKTDLQHRVRRVLDDLRKGAQNVHPVFRQDVKRTMIPVFQEAFDIKGVGCQKERDQLLKHFAESHASGMFRHAAKETERALRELLDQRVKEIIGFAVGSVSLVEEQLKPLFSTVSAPASPAARDDRRRFEAGIKPHLISWELCWQKPSAQREDHVMRGDWSIPPPQMVKVEDDF